MGPRRPNLAGLVIAAVAVREGIQTWRGDFCCTHTRTDHHDPESEPSHDDCGD